MTFELTRARISGTGMYVPDRVVTNDDLAALMDTTDEWIQQRTGIQERRWIDPGQTPADLAFEASKAALDDAGLEHRLDRVFHGRPPIPNADSSAPDARPAKRSLACK